MLERLGGEVDQAIDELRDVARGLYPQALGATIYFCCVECLQNAAKHAGAEASVTIDLAERDGHVIFSVADDGVGFDLTAVERGAGLTNLADRVAAAGGTLTVDARPGRGTTITSELPAQPRDERVV